MPVTSEFSGSDLKRIVELAGQMLESEDRFICGSFARNSIYSKSRQVPGITYFKSEHYYQVLTARALLPSFRFLVRLEYERFDIALFRDMAEQPVALGEMKLWMTEPGTREIPGIKRDMEKLAKTSGGQFLLIFTMSPKGDTDRNVRWLLSDQLQLEKKEHYRYVFDSVYLAKGGDTPPGEFAVIGILLQA